MKLLAIVLSLSLLIFGPILFYDLPVQNCGVLCQGKENLTLGKEKNSNGRSRQTGRLVKIKAC